MFSKLPIEIQQKIIHYYWDIEISKKKQLYKQVHHELLYGWWYTQYPNNVFHVKTQYCEKPTIITTMSVGEIYQLYTSQHVEWKPFLWYTVPIDKPPVFEYDMEYCFAERLPQLITFNDETT